MITLVLLNFTRRLSRKLRPPSRSIKFKTKINSDLNNLLFSCLSCSIPVISWCSNWLIKTFAQTDWGYIGFGFCKLSENCSILDEIRRSLQLWTLLKRVVVNRTWKKFQARTGFEPMTSAIPVQRSTNWANKPTGSWSMNWVKINIQVNEDCRDMKIHIFALRYSGTVLSLIQRVL